MAHGLGHGIGLEVHDPPRPPGRAPERFKPGDVFTIEPGIYVSTRLLDILPDTPKNRAMIAQVRPAVERYHNIGIRIEDDYAITATGVEWLSRAPREVARSRGRDGAPWPIARSRRPVWPLALALLLFAVAVLVGRGVARGLARLPPSGRRDHGEPGRRDRADPSRGPPGHERDDAA